MIKTKEDLKKYIDADFKSQGMKKPFFARFTYGENWALFSYMRNLRYLEYYINKKKRPWDYVFYSYRFLKHRRNCLKYQINISPNTVGPGFKLVHPGFRRIGAYMKIGANCSVLPMVLVGKKSPDVDTSNFIIGDNCYLGTGCTVMGPVRIGNNVTIAAGAVVTIDVPDNAVVAGVPAKIIKIKE